MSELVNDFSCCFGSCHFDQRENYSLSRSGKIYTMMRHLPGCV